MLQLYHTWLPALPLSAIHSQLKIVIELNTNDIFEFEKFQMLIKTQSTAVVRKFAATIQLAMFWFLASQFSTIF